MSDCQYDLSELAGTSTTSWQGFSSCAEPAVTVEGILYSVGTVCVGLCSQSWGRASWDPVPLVTCAATALGSLVLPGALDPAQRLVTSTLSGSSS